MPKRGAPSRPSPEPYVPSRDDERNDSLCLLCGDDLDCWPSQWIELIGASERTAGVAHARCVHDYQLFAAQMPFAAALQAPLF